MSCRGKDGRGREKTLQTLLNFRYTFAVGFLILGGERHQRAINEVHDTSFPSARCTIARYNTRSDRFHFFRFGRSQKFKFLRVRRCRRFVGVFCRCENRGPTGRGPGRAGGC